MIITSKINNIYVGPKAIFDPTFVPPQLLYRKKEQQSLHSILKDSLYDGFPLNIIYQGIQGIGKKVIVNKVMEDLQIENENRIPFQTIRIDCKEKNLEELICSLLAEMNKFSNFDINIDFILNSKISHLWNTFKLASKKIDSYIFLIFNNIEHLKPEVFKKFLHLSKETNTTLISTVNKVLRTSTLDILSEFDQKKKLNYFTYNELFSILKQRAALTFLHEVDKELIEFITDLIFEHYVPVPGKGIDIFRELYPYLKEQKNFKHFEILKVCQNQLDSSGNIDEFNMLTYISEEDPLTIIFLDNLSNYFINKSDYYITSRELKEVYDLTCEALEYEKNLKEFNNLIKMTQKIGIISPSKKSLIDKKYIPNDPLNCVYFFMIVDPYQLKALVDAIFGKI
ncbi:MAG: hypothetical protein ACFFAN_11415 [Promethearchaeota archaeon]